MCGFTSAWLCRWHNEFVEVRQQHRHKLQAALWARSQNRGLIRSSTPHAGAYCELLTTHLAHTCGQSSQYYHKGQSKHRRMHLMSLPLHLLHEVWLMKYCAA